MPPTTTSTFQKLNGLTLLRRRRRRRAFFGESFHGLEGWRGRGGVREPGSHHRKKKKNEEKKKEETHAHTHEKHVPKKRLEKERKTERKTRGEGEVNEGE